MGKVIIQNYTTKDPISLMGYEAGTCWGSDTSNYEMNYNRGKACYEADHGRVLEYPQIYMTISGYSARFGREFYTHIGGGPTRLQSSTRRINYTDGFDYTTPHTIEKNEEALKLYNDLMKQITDTAKTLESLGIPREDSAMVLPLALYTDIVFRTDLRMMVDMAHKRKCSKAFWEFREFFHDFETALKEYSPEWKTLIEDYHIFKTTCEFLGYCPEKSPCRAQFKK